MSLWRITIRALHEAGGEAKRTHLETLTGGVDALAGLQDALRLGLVSSPGRGRRVVGPWRLTELGRAFCEGRAEERVRGNTGGRGKVFVGVSWLAFLPQGVRIEQRTECSQ